MRRRGFTLVELMVVVALLSVVAGLALVSFGRTNRAVYLDGFANDIRTVMTEARRRAIATRNAYLVTVDTDTVQWCQASTTPEAINYATLPTVCPAVPPAGTEMGGLYRASGSGTGPTAAKALAVGWARDVDSGQGGVTYMAMPATLYFLPSGAVDSDLSTPPPSLQGFTLRLQVGSEQAVVRKVVVLPFSGRPRITDSW